MRDDKREGIIGGGGEYDRATYIGACIIIRRPHIKCPTKTKKNLFVATCQYLNLESVVSLTSEQAANARLEYDDAL